MGLCGAVGCPHGTLQAAEHANDEKAAQIAQMEASVEEARRSVLEMQAKLRADEAVRRRLHNTILELKGNIRVFCRIRPTLRRITSVALRCLGRACDHPCLTLQPWTGKEGPFGWAAARGRAENERLPPGAAQVLRYGGEGDAERNIDVLQTVVWQRARVGREEWDILS